MSQNALNGWVRSLFFRRGRTPLRRPPITRLTVERFESRDCPSNTILLNHVDATSQQPLIPTWTAMGPAPELNGGIPGGGAVSGRVSGVAVDPTNPNRIFVTAASGGIWRTLDGGQSWTPLTLHLPDDSPTTPTNITSDALRTLKMGGIAIAPSDPNVIYAGEGEGDSSTIGFGVLKSTDGGNTWTLLGNSALAPLSAKSIVVDNLDPNIVYMNAESFGAPFDTRTNGIFRSIDGGLTWDNITASSPILAGATMFTDVDLAPRASLTQADILYCAVGDGGLQAGIYRSINADAPVASAVTWNLSIGGSTLVPGAGPGNIEMVVSPQFPSTIYATIADNNNALLGVYRTNDSGVNWVRILAGPNFLGTQADYDNVINVSPFDPNVVIVAGQEQELFSSNANAANPNSVVFTDVSVVAGTGPHVDSHASAFDSSGNFLIGDDGGLFRLDIANFNTPLLWEPLNGDNSGSPLITALNTIQFNSVSLDPRDPNLALGGAQDNGTSRFNDNVGWNQVDGGDGGNVVFDFNNPSFAVRVSPIPSFGQAGFMRYSTDGGLTWNAAATPPPNANQNNTLFYPPLIEDPSLSARFYFGSDQIAISEDAGVTWGTTYTFPTGTQTVPGDPSTGLTPIPQPITAIGVGRASGAAAVLYAAHTDGTLYQLIFGPPPNPAPTTMDWINIAPTGAASVGVITQIIVDPQNPQDVYVVGSGGVARTQDALELGFTGTLPVWTKISGAPATGGLPASFGPETLALDPKNFTDATDDVLYVGGDFGVYKLTNPGHPGPGQPGGSPFVWTQVGTSYDSDPNSPYYQHGLPDVEVKQLTLNTTTGILAAATYGAGMWELQVRGLVRGEVFNDVNGNGQFDAGEPGMSGITVRLINSDTGVEVATTTSDANGIYAFRSLTASQLTASNYQIVEVTPSGQVETTAPLNFTGLTEQSTFDIADPNLKPQSVVIGNFTPTSISGTKFDDQNQNGVRNTGEPGVGGFQIFIDVNNSGVFAPGDPTTTTAADGSFTFTNLGPAVINGQPNPLTFNGTYIIREVSKTGWVQTTSPLAAIVLQSGTPIAGLLIGNTRTASISGVKFIDTNGDGIRENSEPAGAGFTINLTGPGGTRTTTTAADGSYSFLSLSPGSYTVTEVVPAGYTNTLKPGAVTVGLASSITGVNFGNFKNVTIGGSKFNDLNGNGILDKGEPGLAGFVFDLVDVTKNTVVAKATSTAAGTFTFTNVGPATGGGKYLVREEQQVGYIQTTTSPASFSISSGTAVSSLTFGNFQKYTVTGTAYVDVNGNFTQDAGEKGAIGYHILLKDASGNVVAQTTTAADGTYSLAGVGPGNFTISEIARNGFAITEGSTGYAVTGQSGSNLTGQSFGNVPRPTMVVGSDAGGPPTVTVRDANTQQTLVSFNAYNPGFQGGVRVATGYFEGNSQTIPDVVAVPGPGGGPHVRVFNGSTGQVLAEFYAYSPLFTGGLYVAVGDVNGDGMPDIITGADAGGGPHVKVFDGAALMKGQVTVLTSFFAFDSNFHGGVRVAAADVNADGVDDIVAAAGPGGGPQIKVFSGKTGGLLQSFFAYDPRLTSGVYVAAADVNGDGHADIITGPGNGGGPHLRVFDGSTNALISQTFAFPVTSGTGQLPQQGYASGLRVAITDYNKDGRPDILVGPGPGQPPQVRIFDALSMNDLLPSTTVFDPTFLGGIFVAGN